MAAPRVSLGRVLRRLWLAGPSIDAGTVFGVPVRLHWSAPLGAFVCGLASGMHFAPGAYLGFAIVILVHVLGHAAAVRLCGAAVVGIDLTAVGGECQWSGRVGPPQRAAIAWGGFAAQLVLLVAVALVTPVLPWLRSDVGGDLLFALVVGNFVIAGLNLLPLRGFDGAEAWRIVPLALARLLRGQRWTPPDVPFSDAGGDEYLPPLPREIRQQLDDITKGVGGRRERA